jgi:hypothetical protein
MSLPMELSARLALPLIAAPMFLVSGVELWWPRAAAGSSGLFRR